MTKVSSDAIMSNTHGLLLRWVFTHTWLLTAGLILGLLATGALHQAGSSLEIAIILFGAIAGATLGLAQAFLLRKRLDKALLWLLSDIVGLAIGSAIIPSLLEIWHFHPDSPETVTRTVLVFASAGATLLAPAGLLQAGVLIASQFRVGAAIVWLVATLIAGATGALIYMGCSLLASDLGTYTFFVFVSTLLPVSLTMGVVTGPPLIWLLHHGYRPN